MVPLAIDNELDHTFHARNFIEKYALRYLASPFPAHTDFLTMDLTQKRSKGYCFPDFAAFAITHSPNNTPRQRVFGFEFKVPAGISVNAVEQACRQKALVNAVYLVLLLPDGMPAENALDRVCREAKHHGVGVIRVRSWLNGEEHEILAKPSIDMPQDPNGPGIIAGSLRNSDRGILRQWTTP